MNIRLEQLQNKWATELSAWAIPDEITEQLDQSPFCLTPDSFTPDTKRLSTPTMQRALEILNKGNSTLLDVGCAAGGTSLILMPPATHITAIDKNEEMLAALRANASVLGINQSSLTVVLSDWPASIETHADVVISANVLYNTQKPVEFITALLDVTNKRLVIELTSRHPHYSINPIYAALHHYIRPETPKYTDILDIISELGYSFQIETWERPAQIPTIDDIDHLARRASIPDNRRQELVDFLTINPILPTTVVTITIDRN